MGLRRLAAAVIVLAVGACGGGATATGAGETSGESTTSASTTEASDASTSQGDELCGNGVLDPGEACDPAGQNAVGCNPDCTQGCFALEWLWEDEGDEPTAPRMATASQDGTSATLMILKEHRWVTVLAPDGTLAWEQDADHATSVAFDSEGRLWVAGEQTESGTFSLLRRFAADGEPELETEVPIDKVWAAGRGVESGIVLGGEDGVVPWVGLADADGNLQWGVSPQTEGFQDDYVSAEAVATDGNGNVLALVPRISLSPRMHLVKLSAVGEQLWEQLVGEGADFGPQGDWPQALAIDRGDGIVLAGDAAAVGEDTTMMVERFDGEGARLWQETPGGVGVATSQEIDIVTSGNPGEGDRMLLQRRSLDGQLTCELWVAFPGRDRTAGTEVAAVPGGVIVAGVLDPGGTFVARFSVHD